ncbi:MAG: redoxin domain-containing protein [Deltaproteobacteria bacterium]|nr:redoxin domain-containing protein [Deltaproteobacteria bacterium]
MNKIAWRIAGLLLLAGWLAACASPRPIEVKTIPPAYFQVPRAAHWRQYLGLRPVAGEFTLNDIKARVVVVEVFQVDCPHCQDEVPYVNRFYHLLQQKGLSEQVKIIGVGTGNTAAQLDVYQRHYGIPFPLFPDPKMVKIDVDVIPAFFVIEPTPAGGRVLYAQYGPLPEEERFLQLIKERAGLP